MAAFLLVPENAGLSQLGGSRLSISLAKTVERYSHESKPSLTNITFAAVSAWANGNPSTKREKTLHPGKGRQSKSHARHVESLLKKNLGKSRKTNITFAIASALVLGSPKTGQDKIIQRGAAATKDTMEKTGKDNPDEPGKEIIINVESAVSMKAI